MTGVKLNKTKLTLKAGSSGTLKATVKPTNAANKTVEWGSLKPSVADVDENGKVTAIKKGTTMVVVATEEGDFSAICRVTVID